MRFNSSNTSKNINSGFSLVELLVAMVIGLFLVGGVVSVLIDSKDHFLTEQEAALIQENARFAIEELSYDIRMAGYTGCKAVDVNVSNTLNTTSLSVGNKWMYDSRGIHGFSRGSGSVPLGFPSVISADVLLDTDVIIINRGEPSDDIIVTSHNPITSTISVNNAGDLERGDILLMASADCGNAAIFQMTGPLTPTTTINNDIAGSSPNNCSSALAKTDRTSYDCSAIPGGSGLTFQPGASLMRFQSNAYYIRNSPATGLPALYRQNLHTNASGNASTQAQEIISGVESFQVLYGVDSDTDGIANRYYTASSIATAATWNSVVSVEITLVMRSTRSVFPNGTSVDLDINRDGTIGAGETFADGFLRQVVRSTIAIRNRGLGL